MSACTVPRTLASAHSRILAASVSVGGRPLSAANFELLVDGRVHEHRQDAGRRAVDGHADRGVGRAQVEAPYSTFMSSSVAIETPELPTLP